MSLISLIMALCKKIGLFNLGEKSHNQCKKIETNIDKTV